MNINLDFANNLAPPGNWYIPGTYVGTGIDRGDQAKIRAAISIYCVFSIYILPLAKNLAPPGNCYAGTGTRQPNLAAAMPPSYQYLLGRSRNRAHAHARPNNLELGTWNCCCPLSSVLMALALLHSHGLFHGHVTPARIMFGSPGRNEAGAATARLCYLEKLVAPGDAWHTGEASSGGVEKDLR